MDDLRKYAPVHHLIIPGWLDRMSMCEIANNGYSEHVELILFPFEQRWLRATLDANRKWERKETSVRMNPISSAFLSNAGFGMSRPFSRSPAHPLPICPGPMRHPKEGAPVCSLHMQLAAR